MLNEIKSERYAFQECISEDKLRFIFDICSEREQRTKKQLEKQNKRKQDEMRKLRERNDMRNQVGKNCKSRKIIRERESDQETNGKA